ncbi:carboxypeptidase-like regulatory domain-containing protein, partial [Acidobacteria bacterium AH-259-D05]|nr:carboxypeptidase-like regulatory domain-containing protein [Acidobacteria bacterium AH-259-D05]
MSLIRSFQKISLAFLIIVLLGSPLALAQVTITGTVVEDDGSTEIPNAFVFAENANTLEFLDADITDASGVFSLSMMPA